MARGLPALQFAAVVAAAGLLATGCGSTTETSVATPTAPARCQATLGVATTNFGVSGGTGSVAVSVARECSWSARSAVPWISVTGGQEGQGEGTVTFRIGENVDPSTRRGSLSVAEQSVQLAQEAAPCRYSIESPESSAPAAGGELSIDIHTHALCNWTLTAAVDWVSMSPTSGKGDGVIHVAVSPNTATVPRSADVTIAGQRVTLSQESRAATPPPTNPKPPAPAPPAPTPPAPTPPARRHPLRRRRRRRPPLRRRHHRRHHQRRHPSSARFSCRGHPFRFQRGAVILRFRFGLRLRASGRRAAA